MTVIFSSDFLVVTREAGGRVVRVRRTSQPLRALDEAREAYRTLGALIPLAERARLGLLNDVRDAPMRNDPEFEALIREFVIPLVVTFGKRATLVKSAIGKLQVNRTARERGASVAVFDDEKAALEYLAPRDTSPRSPPTRTR